jgi:hypothetical protein
MSVDFGSTGQLSIAGTNYLTIDTSGRILKPNQTAFLAGSGSAAAVGADVIFSTTTFNIGSAYNTANGRFTAPVLGRYFFKYHQLAPNANAGDFRVALYANGGGYGGSQFILTKVAGVWDTLWAEAHMYLNVGDYVTVRYTGGVANLYTDGNFIQFSGHLIG